MQREMGKEVIQKYGEKENNKKEKKKQINLTQKDEKIDKRLIRSENRMHEETKEMLNKKKKEVQRQQQNRR